MTLDAISTFEQNVNAVLLGKREIVRRALIVLICRGHMLLEDVPGTGKTVFAKAIARSLEAEYKRIQFTPDLLPSDVTGSSIFNQKTNAFEFMAGPLFTHVLLADEINRATPRTQAALLEAMEERQVTVDGTTYRLPDSFFVIATQNPIEQQGTFPLPEAQLDRFLMKMSIGYPPVESELSVIDIRADSHPVDSVRPVMNLESLQSLRTHVENVFVHSSIKMYILSIVRMTRAHSDLVLGVSPRGALALRRCAQGLALVEGRDYVTPDDVKRLTVDVLSHRIMIKPQVRVGGKSEQQIILEILNSVQVTVEYAPQAP